MGRAEDCSLIFTNVTSTNNEIECSRTSNKEKYTAKHRKEKSLQNSSVNRCIKTNFGFWLYMQAQTQRITLSWSLYYKIKSPGL